MDINKVKEFITENIEKIIFALLFIAPFFWYQYAQIDLGGDAGRLYLYDPGNIIYYTNLFPLNPLNGHNPYQSKALTLPMHSLFLLIRSIAFNNSYFLNVIVQSLTISLSFIFTYEFLKELLNFEKSDRTKKMIAVVASLMYSLSPLFIYDFQRANLHIYSYALYPFFFYNLIAFLNKGKFRNLVWNILMVFVFTFDFSMNNSPWFFGFFGPVFLFVFVYALFNKKIKRLVIGSLILVFFILLVQLYYLYPLFKQIMFPAGRDLYFNPELEQGGLEYFNTIRPFVDLIYNLFNQPPLRVMTTFGNKNYSLMKVFGLFILPVFIIYPFILLFSLFVKIKDKVLNKQKQVYLLGLLIFLVVTFFETANLGLLPVKIYESLFVYVPGFRMFRHYYGKFALPFAFMYSVVIYYSLINLYEYFKGKKFLLYFKRFLYVLLAVIIFNGFPLIGGGIVNSETPGSVDPAGNVKVAVEVSDELESSLDYLRDLSWDSKVLSLPFTMESYQVFQGEKGGGYLGPSTLAMLAGRSTFGGFKAFYTDDQAQTFFTLFFDQSPEKLQRFLGMLNIGLVFHNTDEYIYKYFNETPWGQFKQIFPTQQSLSLLVQVLGGKLDFESGPYKIYRIDDYFLPHIYIPKVVYRTNKHIYEFFKEHDFTNDPVRLSVFTDGDTDNNIDFNGEIAEFNDIPSIQINKINPVKYYVRVSNAKEPYILVLNDPINSDWKIYLKENGAIKNVKNEQLADIGNKYTSFVGGFTDNVQPGEQVSVYFDGNITELESHMRFLEPNTFETWGRKPIAENSLTRINGYANSWYITPDDAHGETNYELVIEYTGHQMLYITGLVAIVVVSILSVYLIIDYSILLVNKLRKRNG